VTQHRERGWLYQETTSSFAFLIRHHFEKFLYPNQVPIPSNINGQTSFTISNEPSKFSQPLAKENLIWSDNSEGIVIIINSTFISASFSYFFAQDAKKTALKREKYI